MKIKKKPILFVCIAVIICTVFLSHPFLRFHNYSDKKTVIDLPENLKYDFSEFDLKNYRKTDEIETDGFSASGEKVSAVREYFANKETDEELIRISTKPDGKFLKGYYFSPNCSSVFYEDKTMKLFGEKTGKIYCFKDSRLRYVSEMKVSKRLYSSVYVITYYGSDANRLALETQTAYMNGNVKAVRFLYDRSYNKIFLPISRKKLEKILCG